VSSTHASRVRLSRRSEISSIGDWTKCAGATSSLVLGCEILVGYAGLTDLVTSYSCPSHWCFVSTVDIGVTGTGSGVGRSAGVPLRTRPPRTWFQPGPWFSCSVDGSARSSSSRMMMMKINIALPSSSAAATCLTILVSHHSSVVFPYFSSFYAICYVLLLFILLHFHVSSN
jgi:hypothetical protein